MRLQAHRHKGWSGSWFESRQGQLSSGLGQDSTLLKVPLFTQISTKWELANADSRPAICNILASDPSGGRNTYKVKCILGKLKLMALQLDSSLLH